MNDIVHDCYNQEKQFDERNVMKYVKLRYRS